VSRHRKPTVLQDTSDTVVAMTLLWCIPVAAFVVALSRM
jgi:hypothetical protein